MQACRRSLAPREIDHELLWLLVSLGTFASLAFWFAAALPTPPCVFHSLTGLPCPTCGSTRAAYHFLHGHFAVSFLLNPLAFLSFCALVIFDLYALAVLLTRAPRFRLQQFSPADQWLLRSLALALIAANWFYLLAADAF
ncbi:MAG: DUF2752 domain-containing protein [Verrucomicrobiota bacterium]|nr:DUF2752 domain-containing protein [Verrucomicrobiota bacterium]